MMKTIEVEQQPQPWLRQTGIDLPPLPRLKAATLAAISCEPNLQEHVKQRALGH